MNLKDKLTRKLLDAGKKHRLLVYPTLALVAVITAISHAVYWGRGNGKKVVASIMIMTLLITQSLFLTSSANVTTDEGTGGTEISTEEVISTDLEDTTDTGEVQLATTEQTTTEQATTEQDMSSSETTEEDQSSETTTEASTTTEENQNPEATTEALATTEEELVTNSQPVFYSDGEGEEVTGHVIYLNRVDESGNAFRVAYGRADDQYVESADGKTVSFYVPTAEEVKTWATSNQDAGYFSCNGIYTDKSCTNSIAGGQVLSFDKRTDGEYNFFFKITREKYPVYIKVGNVDVTDICEVPSTRTEGDINPTATYTVKAYNDPIYAGCEGKGAYAWGYDYSGLSYNGGAYAAGTSITINPTEENFTGVTMGVNWTPQNIDVNYIFVGADDKHITVVGDKQADTKTYKYDWMVSLLSTVETSNTGYYLAGWEDSDGNFYALGENNIDSKSLATKGSDITATETTSSGSVVGENMVGKTLTAVWEYKNITLTATGENAVASENSVAIKGTYGDSISTVISAKYTQGDLAPKYEIKIPDSEIAKLNSYGLLVTPNKSDEGRVTSYTIEGTLRNVTTSTLQIPFVVTDYNRPTNNPNVSQSFDMSILLTSDKKEVSLDASTIKHNNHDGAPSKPYDGNVNIKVNTEAQVTGRLSSDNVYVTFDADATLDDANAGEGKAITLSNVKLDGSQAGMYTLAGITADSTSLRVEKVATVTRIAVSVTTALATNSSDNILFGQQTPVYTVDLANPSLLAPDDKIRYDALSTPEAKDSFMRQIIGFTGTWDTTRSLYSPAGSYTITPVFSDANVNYSVSATGVTSTFVVNRDSGDGKYTLSPEAINNYYPSLTVSPSGGVYDKVRLIEGDGDITEGMNPSEVEGLFSSSVTITKDMTNGTIRFQMYDSETGAITYPVSLTGINIDGTGPELVSYSVSPNISYFNEFGFGAYYHAQNIDGVKVESVEITFEYKTDDSECAELVYFFTDEDGSVKSEFNGKHALVKDALTNNYKATVTIGTGVSGQLVVYAVDTTGNPSGQSKVKLQEAINYIREGQSAQNYYEWMVENTINSADIVVTDINGNGTSEGVWYNGLNFNVLAADSDSGVNKIVWSITDPTGTTTSSTENAHDSVSMVVAGTKNGTATDYGKLTTYDFNTSISGEEALTGEYTVSAVLYDNAGNNVVLKEKGPYLFDGKAPIISCDDYESEDGEYLSGVVFDFAVTEGENESGVSSVKLYYGSESEETLLNSWGVQDGYSQEITSNGTYVIVATDVAGNVSRKEVKFSGISDVIPDVPVISVDGTLGNDGWYKETMPTVTILSSEKTSDGVPVVTTYKITAGGNQMQASVDSEEQDLVITSEGEILIEAWSKSKANCVSDTATKTIKIDVNGPDVTITDSSKDENGNTLISFTVTDEISGVNQDKIFVNDELVEVEDIDGVITGSFVATDNQVYTIKAEDIAGNVSEDVEFTPLTLQVSPVVDITPTGAYIEARVYEGTNPISDCYIAYKKASESDYDTCLSNKHNEDYGISMDYQFRNLESDTVYDYRVYAIAANSNEVQVIEGSFRTADLSSTATVYGSVIYSDELPDTYKTYPVYVALYEANTVIAGVQLDSEDDTEYLFKNVADGNYRVVASNGMLSEVSTVTVTNGGITYPENYATSGGIHFVLDGLSTEVVIEDNAINITADGLDKIYNTALYNGNVTDEDLEVVAAGGTIDITLHANYINVSDVGQTTESIFINKIGQNGVIERYIQLYIMKEVRDVDGKLVNGTPTNITRLAEPVTVSFPLGDLSGQKIYVASVHGSGDNYTFQNWSDESKITISQSFVTISTDRFSVYALYRLIETKKEYTVKWVDGDGNVMKTETVVEGNPATPPTDTPKKSESTKYTYTFSGWDTDYTSINKDTIISAWFVANKKVDDTNKNDTPTTEAPNNKPTQNKNDGGVGDITKEPTNYPYMGTGISPQTGDEAPIVALALMMFASATGLILINKKRKEN